MITRKQIEMIKTIIGVLLIVIGLLAFSIVTRNGINVESVIVSTGIGFIGWLIAFSEGSVDY